MMRAPGDDEYAVMRRGDSLRHDCVLWICLLVIGLGAAGCVEILRVWPRWTEDQAVAAGVRMMEGR
jgi:hypothetical protein